jgi:hypothetical protein
MGILPILAGNKGNGDYLTGHDLRKQRFDARVPCHLQCGGVGVLASGQPLDQLSDLQSGRIRFGGVHSGTTSAWNLMYNVKPRAGT